jgi:methyl-accepting chemotaxis protein
MRSLKEQIPLIVIGSIIILTMGLMLVIHFHDQSASLVVAATKAKRDLDVSEAIIDLKYPGSWDIKGEDLYKGRTDINNYFTIVDYIKNLTGDECVIFQNNMCVSTTVSAKDCDRALGIYAPYEVTSKALETRQYYTGESQLAGKIYQFAYKPITNANGLIIGVLYIGVPTTPYNTIFYGLAKTVGLAGLVIALLAGLITRFIVTKNIVKPLQDVINGIKKIAGSRTGQPLKIQSSNEIGELFQAFSQMYVGIQKTENGLPKANEESRQIDRENESTTKQEQISGGNGEDEWFDTLLDSKKELPKGLSLVTLKQIILFLKQQEGNEVTIQDVSKATGLSSVSVRHYFGYLSEIDLVDIEQRYGSVGRPLRFFKLKM